MGLFAGQNWCISEYTLSGHHLSVGSPSVCFHGMPCQVLWSGMLGLGHGGQRQLRSSLTLQVSLCSGTYQQTSANQSSLFKQFNGQTHCKKRARILSSVVRAFAQRRVPAKRVKKGPSTQTPRPYQNVPTNLNTPGKLMVPEKLLEIYFLAGISTLPAWAPPATN